MLWSDSLSPFYKCVSWKLLCDGTLTLFWICLLKPIHPCVCTITYHLGVHTANFWWNQSTTGCAADWPVTGHSFFTLMVYQKRNVLHVQHFFVRSGWLLDLNSFNGCGMFLRCYCLKMRQEPVCVCWKRTRTGISKTGAGWSLILAALLNAFD